MKIYLIICEDSTNLFPVYAAFTTEGKAQKFFAKELEDYWPKSKWDGDSYDEEGKTAEECIERMDFSDGDNFMYAKELDTKSEDWM